ncbi:MAG: adenylyltransferase/cytidyltransferase family protein [Planctomycetota bacterium]|nr:adenylyltransferase/cytidyltransferase family protein [Planctomycetota bacterium]
MTLKPWSQDLEAIDAVREKQGRIVVASGCFDFIHIGHLEHFKEARKLGDCLVVLISDDASVKAMKGKERPVFHETDRRDLLLALEPVDFVFIHPQFKLLPLLTALAPCTFVKGPDYQGQTPKLLRDIVGDIVVAGDVKKDSTSAIIERCATIYQQSEKRRIRGN